MIRAADAAAALATNQLRTAQYLAGSNAGAEVLSASEFIRQSRGPFAPTGTGIEIYTPDLQPLFSEGHQELPPAAADSAELAAATGGRPSWILRRPGSVLVLYVAAPERILDEPFVVRASIRLDSLDSYGRSQLLLLAASALMLTVLLVGAAFLGSRAIAGRLEVLATQAAAMAGGDYRTRAAPGGAAEIASLARGFNWMAESVESAVTRLRAEKEDRQAFIDDLTHELRTPITSIVGFADHLRRRPYDQVVFSEGLARIHAEGMRILSVSEGLKRLLISRTDGKALARENAGELLGLAADEARTRHPGTSFALELPDEPLAVNVDRTLILTALANLVDNAVRACPPGATVVLGAARTEATTRLFVRDPGGATPGTGLGLGKAICREIADYHGATLSYAHAPGGGTIAAVDFPNLQ